MPVAAARRGKLVELIAQLAKGAATPAALPLGTPASSSTSGRAIGRDAAIAAGGALVDEARATLQQLLRHLPLHRLVAR